MLDAFIRPPSLDCICYTRGNNIEVALVGADKAPLLGSRSELLQAPGPLRIDGLWGIILLAQIKHCSLTLSFSDIFSLLSHSA